MAHEITLLPGDGIGPEVTQATLRAVEATGVTLVLDEHKAGVSALEAKGEPLPASVLDSIRRTGVALKGPLTTPSGAGFRSVNVALRQEFDLYANVRPVRTMFPGRYRDVDLVLVRENTEGLYVGVEHYIGVGQDRKAAAESVMIVTRFGSERIVRYAFEYARRHARRKVTLVHKANILKLTQGLFLEAGREIAKGYPEIAFEDRIIDATAMQLVLGPSKFDVLVTENMFGDILSDELAGLVGGLGFAPAANVGSGVAIFEAVHGSAPDIAGQGVANPTALMLAACLLLEHLDEAPAAQRLRAAVQGVWQEGRVRTRDAGGRASTAEFTEAVCARIRGAQSSA